MNNDLKQLNEQLHSAICNEDWQHALACIDELDALMPDNPSVIYNKGLILKNMDQPKLAVAQFKAALEIDETHTSALFELASCEVDCGNYADARRHFESFLRSQPDDHDAMTNLGNLLIRSGEFETGRLWLRKAYDKNPSIFIVQSLAIAERECGNLETCRQLLGSLDHQDAGLAATRLKIMTQGSKGHFSLSARDYLSAR